MVGLDQAIIWYYDRRDRAYSHRYQRYHGDLTMRKHIYLVTDTECVGLTNKSVYDIAWRIVDKHNTVMCERSYLVREVITNGRLMYDAFYAKKVFDHYIPRIASGSLILKDWNEIKAIMRDDIATHQANVFCAYNLGFDAQAIKHTNALFNTDKFLGAPIALLDLWNLACHSILSHKHFITTAINQGWVSNKGNIQTSAEKAYAYVSGDYGFVESHTALEDVVIETEILHRSLRQKKAKMFNKLNSSPWKIVAQRRLALGL